MKLEVKHPDERNYAAKVVQLNNLRKHDNADRLQCATIDFQNVITGLDAQPGDVYVYFPVECKINADFLRETNSFREATLNVCPNEKGFFEKNCRVKAIKLRGEKSMGYIVPSLHVEEWLKLPNQSLSEHLNVEFDTINDVEVCRKYVVKKREPRLQKSGKKPKVDRLVDGQVHLHVDTENLRRNVKKIHPQDEISISYKTHGTSFWVSHVLSKRKLPWWEKLSKKIGLGVQETEYDYIYGSRRVVKNACLEDPKAHDHFYSYDLWEVIKDELKEYIPKGYTIYGECLGYTKDGAFIQGPYDYGCQQGEHKLYIYRVTFTNEDGLVTELTTKQIQEFCKRYDLVCAHVFYTGKAMDIYPELTPEYCFESKEAEDQAVENWRVQFVEKLEQKFNEKNCFMCNNEVPEEGIVVRKESMFDYEVYKLKSFAFLEKESKDLDSGESNLEEEN